MRHGLAWPAAASFTRDNRRFVNRANKFRQQGIPQVVVRRLVRAGSCTFRGVGVRAAPSPLRWLCRGHVSTPGKNFDLTCGVWPCSHIRSRVNKSVWGLRPAVIGPRIFCVGLGFSTNQEAPQPVVAHKPGGRSATAAPHGVGGAVGVQVFNTLHCLGLCSGNGHLDGARPRGPEPFALDRAHAAPHDGARPRQRVQPGLRTFGCWCEDRARIHYCTPHSSTCWRASVSSRPRRVRGAESGPVAPRSGPRPGE